MLARVAPQKDFDTLIRTAARYVCQLLRQAGLTDSFIFTGYRADALRLLESFDIAVLRTHFEGLPLALLEAMAHAKAVVVTGVNGFLPPTKTRRASWQG